MLYVGVKKAWPILEIQPSWKSSKMIKISHRVALFSHYTFLHKVSGGKRTTDGLVQALMFSTTKLHVAVVTDKSINDPSQLPVFHETLVSYI